MPEAESPSIWQRFFTRAVYVKSRPKFQAQIASIREKWDHTHPGFPVRIGEQEAGAGWRPPRPNVRYPYPLSVEIYLAENRTPDASDLEVLSARHDWDAEVSQLAAEWWPARYFAHWRTPWASPNEPFVAACLRWGPRDVDVELWIPGGAQAIYQSHFHPLELTSNPLWAEQAAYIHTLKEALMEAMYADLIDSKLLLEVFTKARQKATEAYYAAGSERSVEYVFLRVFPGIQRKDWDQLWESLSRGGFGRDDLRKWVAELRDEGKGDLTIANLLGMKRSTVQSIPRSERGSRTSD